jgi:hypothetical protein
VNLPTVPIGLSYKLAAVVALLVAGAVFKHNYDQKIADNALLKEHIKADSVALATAEVKIADANAVAEAATARADSLFKRAVVDSTRAHITRVAYDSIRANFDTTSVVQLNDALRAADATIADQDVEIDGLWESVYAEQAKTRAVLAREAEKDEKIAALERLNKNIAKAVTQPTHHLRDGAIGGAIVAVGGAILWAKSK